ncbi:hypothetical protein WMY93_023495 [Mugilogobius chulae]|uniref:Uncharacterized protein n=1 Tax=Mugilogobius chulae TaxID=88201 RepID=A0AAW0NA15_9GOBI
MSVREDPPAAVILTKKIWRCFTERCTVMIQRLRRMGQMQRKHFLCGDNNLNNYSDSQFSASQPPHFSTLSDWIGLFSVCTRQLEPQQSEAQLKHVQSVQSNTRDF